MQASGPILKQYPLKGTSDPTRKKWLQQFPVERNKKPPNSPKCFKMQRCLRQSWQEAAIQYGLPMEQSLKFPLEVFSSW